MTLGKKKTKLPPKFKAKWLEALRSEEYNQGRGKLFDYPSNSYCCLGVACRVAGIGRDNIEYNEILHDLRRKHCKRLPTALKNMDITSTLMWMNDKEEKDFKEIANYIEESL